MKLGAFILTYRRPEALSMSLEVLLAQTRPPDRLLVVDNAASEETRAQVAGLDRPELAYVATPENLGSAGGTAYGTTWLAERGFDLVYSGDDDNPPRTPDTLERLLELLAGSDPEVAGVGTVGARFDWSTGELRRLEDEELRGAGPVEVDFVGGDHKLILRRGVIESVGPPEARLFFGYPDLEHCLRIRRAGYKLLIDGELMRWYRRRVGHVDHSPGRSPVPRRARSAIWRNYYTTRNYIFMMRRTFERPDLARREALKAVGRALASWSRGPGYGAAFTRLQLAGVVDGYRGRLGCTVEPRAKAERAR